MVVPVFSKLESFKEEASLPSQAIFWLSDLSTITFLKWNQTKLGWGSVTATKSFLSNPPQSILENETHHTQCLLHSSDTFETWTMNNLRIIWIIFGYLDLTYFLVPQSSPLCESLAKYSHFSVEWPTTFSLKSLNICCIVFTAWSQISIFIIG